MKKFALLLALALPAVLHAQQTPTLKVGSPAPKLSVYKLIKGAPFKPFQPGKVYVVEFWATWCGPCRESIPHLTELAKKFKGKVTFIGVDSFEEDQQSKGNKKTTYLKEVRNFVKQMGAKMNYNVVADDPTGHLGKSWMDAAGQDGIPTAFVVDQKKRIAWIGHPMMGLDDVVAKVVKGHYKPVAAAPAAAAQPNPFKDLVTAVEAHDNKAIVAECDKLIAKDPANEKVIATVKFNALVEINPADALAYAKQASEGTLKNDPESLNNFAWAMVDPAKPLPGADPVFAEAISRRAIGLLEKSDNTHAMTMDTLAAALYAQGKKDEAIAEEKLAIDEATGRGNQFPASALADFKKHLDLFQATKSA